MQRRQWAEKRWERGVWNGNNKMVEKLGVFHLNLVGQNSKVACISMHFRLRAIIVVCTCLLESIYFIYVCNPYYGECMQTDYYEFFTATYKQTTTTNFQRLDSTLWKLKNWRHGILFNKSTSTAAVC